MKIFWSDQYLLILVIILDENCISWPKVICSSINQYNESISYLFIEYDESITYLSVQSQLAQWRCTDSYIFEKYYLLLRYYVSFYKKKINYWNYQYLIE